MDNSDSDMSDDDDDDNTARPTRPPVPLYTQPGPSSQSSASIVPLRRGNHNPLFTKEELAVLSPGVIDRSKLKQQAKKAKKRQMAQAKTEGELMYGMMGMDVEHQEPLDISNEAKVSARQLKKDKKRARDAKLRQEMQAAKAQARPVDGGMELDVDQKKEADFAAFLANVGGE
jgi:nuclear GTP-binding protein